MKVSKKNIVAVGVSGGVDSSVAAYVLKKAGYTVIGIFVKTWSPEWLPCTWVAEKRDAMRVCASLDIPFYFLDASEVYKKEIADYMIAEYQEGRTPNPDVLCNKVIKFGAMWEYAQQLGATYIATGHYARTDGTYLFRAADTAKDQSYFLWMMNEAVRTQCLLPLGLLQKKEVRAIAAQAGLLTAAKKDSQGICFLGEVDMKEFLSHYITQRSGEVRTADQRVVGEHDGVWFYTIGERRGFRITEKNSERKAYYVIGKDVEQNILFVGHAHDTIKMIDNTAIESQQAHAVITLREVCWHSTPSPALMYTAQLRYHGEIIPVERIVSDTQVILRTVAPIALGQSIVFYQEDMLVGGGIVTQLTYQSAQ